MNSNLLHFTLLLLYLTLTDLAMNSNLLHFTLLLLYLSLTDLAMNSNLLHRTEDLSMLRKYVPHLEVLYFSSKAVVK
jgi:hypothetical protein